MVEGRGPSHGYHGISRRRLLVGSAALPAALSLNAATGRAEPQPWSPPTDSEQITLPPTTFAAYHSPPMRPFVDPLTIPPRRQLGGTIDVAELPHRFHRDLPVARSWGFAGCSHGGPTIEVRAGDDVETTFVNRLGVHAARELIDRSLHGVSALDREHPPVVIHLHGAPNRPSEDGFPMPPFRPGESQRHRFSTNLPATALWYHDHSMGNTRLNVYLGLTGHFWIRDEFDTGRADNPLGLPSGRYEIPLTIGDKLFYPNGMARYNSTPTEIGRGHWLGGLCGDAMVVNGTVWPYLPVDRGVYRFRTLSASQLNSYRLSLSDGTPFWVISSDGGLLDEPAWVRAVNVSPSERYDLLVDFSRLRRGQTVDLRNSEQISWAGQLPGGARIENVMRFVGTGRPAPVTTIPARLRGGSRRPARLPAPPRPTVPDADHTMNTGLSPKGGGTSLLAMSLDNLGFDDTDVDEGVQGTVQRWNLINTDLTTQVHAIHLHLVQFRVLGHHYDQPRYMLESRIPVVMGRRWAPSATRYLRGPLQPPAPYERGWKDTVRCPPGMVTHLVVRWPTSGELGFNPDEPFRDRLGQAGQGYIWHCHMLDHEDNEMMRRLRIVDPMRPRPLVPLPPMPDRAIELLPGIGIDDPRNGHHGHGTPGTAPPSDPHQGHDDHGSMPGM